MVRDRQRSKCYAAEKSVFTWVERRARSQSAGMLRRGPRCRAVCGEGLVTRDGGAALPQGDPALECAAACRRWSGSGQGGRLRGGNPHAARQPEGLDYPARIVARNLPTSVRRGNRSARMVVLFDLPQPRQVDAGGGGSGEAEGGVSSEARSLCEASSEAGTDSRTKSGIAGSYGRDAGSTKGCCFNAFR